MKVSLPIKALLLLLVIASSCNKDKSSELDGAWLFPIAKGSLSINSLSELKNLQYHFLIPSINIGQPANVPLSSPGLHLSHVGPFGVQITDWLHRLDVDTLEFTGSLTNIFPIPIGAGTIVSMRNTRDTNASNIMGTAVISSDVPPNGVFSFDIQVMNKSLGDSVFFYLDNFISPPYSNVVFTSTPTKLDITLKVITASFVQIYTNKYFYSLDTSEFSAGTDDQLGNNTGGTFSDTTVSGYINVFLDNGMPANALSQLYFLDESKTQVLDSLFSAKLTIGGAATDVAGNSLNTVSTINKVPITHKKLDHIKQAKFVVSQFDFNTSGFPGAYVSANKTPKLAVQFTGDLNIRIKF